MFTRDDMVSLHQATPFVAFRLYLSDGGTVHVPSRELVSVGRRMAVIGILDPGQADAFFDRWMTVSYLHVSRFELLGAGPPPFSTPPASGSESPVPTRG